MVVKDVYIHMLCVNVSGWRDSPHKSYQDEKHGNCGASFGQRCQSVSSGQGKTMKFSD